ncbi:MAG: HPr family phosphocarrier protein [Planctomycetota bacterium]
MSVVRAQAKVVNPNGIHARPASVLIKALRDVRSRVTLSVGTRKADARSILELMMLTAVCGAEVGIEADGEDAQQAVDTLVALFASGFGEGA